MAMFRLRSELTDGLTGAHGHLSLIFWSISNETCVTYSSKNRAGHPALTEEGDKNADPESRPVGQKGR